MVTVFVLKVLSVSLPEMFPLVFTPKMAVEAEGKAVAQSYRSGVEKAVQFVFETDRQLPSIPVRLELGYNWEEAVTKLLMFDKVFV